MAKYLKKAERKKQIKDAAIELIKIKGYRYTSVQDIVDRSKTSKGGFYHCYSSKTELIKEIIDDGCSYRYDEMKRYKDAHKNLDKKTLFIEMIIDKIFSDNKYKRLYSMLLMEMGADKDLFNCYKDGSKVAQNMYTEFYKNEGFDNFVNLNDKEYEVFINSLIMGVEAFEFYDSENYRNMIRTMLTTYLENIGLFNEDA